MASRNKAQIDSLIQGLQRSDPRLYEVLKRFNEQFNSLLDDVDVILTAVASEGAAVLPNITTFNYELLDFSVKLTWNRPADDVQYFEIRQGSGSWETATFVLATKALSVNLEPLTVGTHTYQIRATDESGNYSVSSKYLDIIIPALGSISITSQVIDNNVLLKWTQASTSFQVKEYIVRRGVTEIGRQTGTFTVIFEQSAGTFDYSILPVDIAGNIGLGSSISVTVSAPRDYILQSQGVDTLFDGTRVSAYLDDTPSIYVPVDITETWEQHFTRRGWNTPQNQIDAGYPVFIQPTLSTAVYTKIFDYGSVFSNVLATITYSLIQIVDLVTVSIRLRYSTDLISWSTPIIASSVFATSLQYLEVELTFTPSV